MKKSTTIFLLGLILTVFGFGLAYYSAQTTYASSGMLITVIQHPYFTIGSVVMAIGLLVILFGFGLREFLRKTFSYPMVLPLRMISRLRAGGSFRVFTAGQYFSTVSTSFIIFSLLSLLSTRIL